MTQKNHFQINRRLLDHPLWISEPFTKGQAWVDLIGRANYKDSHFYKKITRIDIKRGQTSESIVNLGKRWGWSRGKVSRFLNLLETEQMIVQQRSNQTTIVTICNYDVYQLDSDDDGTSSGTADRTPDGQATGHRTDIKRTGNGTHPIRIKKEPIRIKKEYPPNSDEFRVADFLYRNILKNKPDFKWGGKSKPNFQNWADDARLMLRRDKRDLETVKKLITWCCNDDFEKSQILSIVKLRKRFDSLEMKMNKPAPKNNTKPEEKTFAEVYEDMKEEYGGEPIFKLGLSIGDESEQQGNNSNT